ncbi:hypothetical protein LTR53_013515 [Teratosphaeriaceae sp. CCFEE 6253]|nr:hypothetical protein LTR53_013515 [Teratosphaeriaceae sp. CCFEE 6253]
MALLTVLLVGAAYAADKLDHAAPKPSQKHARHRSRPTEASLPREPSAPTTQPPLHRIFHQLLRTNPHAAHTALPALHLATRFLTTDAFLAYWFIVFSSPAHELPMPPEYRTEPKPKHTHHEFAAPLPSHLTRAQLTHTKYMLAQLADSVTLDLASPAPVDAGGRCKALRHQPASPASTFPSGHKSLVQISAYFLRTLTHPAVSERDRVWLHFELAKTLLHELAHAAVNAARGKRSGEHFFFRGGVVAEDGFQLEACLFGGKIDLRRAEFHRMLWRREGEGRGKAEVDRGEGGRRGLIRGYWTPWPSAAVVEEYRARGSPIGVRGAVPSHRHGREIIFERIRRLFGEGAWEEDVRRYGAIRLV